jgi:hypothetical protein
VLSANEKKRLLFELRGEEMNSDDADSGGGEVLDVVAIMRRGVLAPIIYNQ